MFQASHHLQRYSQNLDQTPPPKFGADNPPENLGQTPPRKFGADSTHASVEVQTDIIQTAEVAIQVDLPAPQKVDLTPLQPVPVEQIAEFGLDLDVVEICQLESLPISEADLQAELAEAAPGSANAWTLFTPEQVLASEVEQVFPQDHVQSEVDPAWVSGIQADVDHLCQLVRVKPLATQRVQQADNLIQVQHIEFSQLTYYGNASLPTQGPVHRSWDDIEKNYEEYVVQSLTPATYRRDRMRMRFSQLRYKPSKVQYFEATVDGQVVALTQDQFREMFPEKPLPITVLLKTTARVARKIRRRFSRRYRDYLDFNSKVNKRRRKEPVNEVAWKEIQLKRIPKLTTTIDALIDAHFDLVMLEGDSKLPVAVEEQDSEHSDEEFFFRYLNQKTVEQVELEEQEKLFEAKQKKLQAAKNRKLYMREYRRQRYQQNKEEICRKQREKRARERSENPRPVPPKVIPTSEEQAALERERKDRRNELARGRTAKRALLRELNRSEKTEVEIFRQLERQHDRRNELARERHRRQREKQGLEYNPRPQ